MVGLSFRHRRSVLGAAACAVALGLVIADLVTWVELDVAVIYGLPLILAATTRSLRLLWILAIALITANFVAYAFQISPHTFTLREPFFVNRVLSTASLLFITGLLHVLMNEFDASEAQARLIKVQSDELESARFSQELVELQETERRTLANQLHDLVGQKLTALSINLHIMKTPKALSMPASAAQHNARLDDSLNLVEETIGSIRDVMTELSPAVLFDYGLTPALRWYAEQFTNRTGIGVAVKEQGPVRRLPPRVEAALFRIAQEALANAAKHARAGAVTVTLGITDRDFCLSIADDGCGFDTTVSQQPAGDHGWGLMMMRERAAAVDAQFAVQSAPGRGSRVIVTVRSDARD